MTKFEPYVLFPTMGSFKRPVLVCASSFAGAVRVVCDRLWFPVQGKPVVDFAISAHQLPGSVNQTYQLDEKTPWIKLASELKKLALEFGASPEAVLLIHGISPFTQKELGTMAKEATAKVSRKPKAAAAETPAPKAARKGNPEALAKARKARSENAGPDTRKLTILNKENPYRADSNRAAAFDALKGAKTVQDYLDAGGKAKYVSRWVEEGRISVK